MQIDINEIDNTTLFLNTDFRYIRRIDEKLDIINCNGQVETLDNFHTEVTIRFSKGNTIEKIAIQNKLINLQKQKVRAIVLKLLSKKILINNSSILLLDLTPKWILAEIFFELTKNCNLHCNHCYIPDHVNYNELVLKNWMTITDQAYNLGVNLIKITGGEPLLHKNFFEIVHYIKSSKINIRVYTNGSLLTRNSIKQMHVAGIEEIQISLDGGVDITHDQFRKTKGNFNHICKHLPILLEYNFKVILSFTVTDFNVDEINDFITLARSFQNIKVIISPYINYHQTFKGNNILKVMPNTVKKVMNSYKNNKDIWSNKTEYFTTYSNKYIGYCGAGIYSSYVSSEGNMLICPLLNLPSQVIGNLKKSSLSHIWNKSPMLLEFRSKTTKDIDDCNTCKSVEWCRGGCRARAYYNSVNLFSKDPISCILNGVE